jgi:hypothetical protein
MLIDLHTHTRPLSWDSYLTPDELIEKSKAVGLDGICLSEHDYFWEPGKVLELGKKHNYLVLPAIEINTEDGHMLCYGLEKYVYGMPLLGWPVIRGPAPWSPPTPAWNMKDGLRGGPGRAARNRPRPLVALGSSTDGSVKENVLRRACDYMRARYRRQRRPRGVGHQQCHRFRGA